MSDIVERLEAGPMVTQYNRAGVLETYQATPSPIDLEAAAEIRRLRSEIEKAVMAEREACAKIADKRSVICKAQYWGEIPFELNTVDEPEHIAELIRARGKD